MIKTVTESPPLIAREEAPGPLMVRVLLPLLSIVSGAVLSVIVAGKLRLKLIVSPELALLIASRSEPGPLSLVVVTVIVLPKTGTALRRPNTASADQTHFNALANGDGLIQVPP